MARADQIAAAARTIELDEFEDPSDTVRRIMQDVATEPPSADEYQGWRDLYPLTDEEIAHIEELVYRREGIVK